MFDLARQLDWNCHTVNSVERTRFGKAHICLHGDRKVNHFCNTPFFRPAGGVMSLWNILFFHRPIVTLTELFRAMIGFLVSSLTPWNPSLKWGATCVLNKASPRPCKDHQRSCWFFCSRLSFSVKEALRNAETALERQHRTLQDKTEQTIRFNQSWAFSFWSNMCKCLQWKWQFCNHLLEQQPQSQRLKETEQIDKERWQCAAECSVLPRDDDRRKKPLNIMDGAAHHLHILATSQRSDFRRWRLFSSAAAKKKVTAGGNFQFSF